MVIGLIAYCSGKVDRATPSNASSGGLPALSAGDDAAWVGQHASDPLALFNRFKGGAQVRCAAGADGYLRSIASHDFSWDAGADSSADKFDRIDFRSAGDGTFTLISAKAKLANAFGAFTHVPVYCVYDPRSDSARYSYSEPADDEASRGPVAPAAVGPVATPAVGEGQRGSEQGAGVGLAPSPTPMPSIPADGLPPPEEPPPSD